MQALLRLSATLLLCTLPLAAQKPEKPIVDIATPYEKAGVTVTGDTVKVENVMEGNGPGWHIVIAPGPQAYPGIDIAAPAGKPFDLSGYGRVDIKLLNTGDKKLRVSLRVDNDGDWHLNPWNAEIATLLPGKPTVLSVYFGISFGKPAYAVKPEAITHIKVIGTKAIEEEKFDILAITAAGKTGDTPPIDPLTLRTKPTNGIVFAKDTKVDAAKQLSSVAGAKAELTPEGIAATFGTNPKQAVMLKPVEGRWDLRDYTEVSFKVKNTGKSAITPSAMLTSNDGPTETYTTAKPLQPGEEGILSVSFIPSKPWVAMPADSPKNDLYHGRPGTGTTFANDTVSAFAVSVAEPVASSLLIESITAHDPPAVLPAWLGKRPPVEGAWTETFDEEFNGNAIDGKKWNIYGENYYDQRTHWAKDEVIVKDGHVTLRYEKKTGAQNDDPKGKVTDYAAGFLDTYGKFAQRYGYWEARMKLPSAPGLWPGFWTMPDRGEAYGNKFQRSDTHNDGMELDIMEFLSRWETRRYNVAFHWDGYNAQHRSTGNTKNYVQPDKDGYITAGMLWQPGLIVMYCNGKEVSRFEDARIPSAPEYILFTLPSGGWDNDALDDKKLPADWIIDYVRVWQRKDLADLPPYDAKEAAAKYLKK